MGQGCGGEAQFDLPEKLRTACWLMVDRVRWLLDQRGAPAGWRIEVVVGRAVAHAHVGLDAFGEGEET